VGINYLTAKQHNYSGWACSNYLTYLRYNYVCDWLSRCRFSVLRSH